MKYFAVILLIAIQCQSQNSDQMKLNNKDLQNHSFLDEMYNDDYFPNFLVDKGKNILIELCQRIEKNKPNDLKGLYKLTHIATIEFNELQDEFFQNDSEIETMARESIAEDFEFIARSYGYKADIEELIAPRDW